MIYHHYLNNQNLSHEYVWEENNTPCFQELIVSWNALRPLQGRFNILISVYANQWTDWLSYASWGSSEQSGGNDSSSVAIVQEDILSLKFSQATGFRIRIVSNQQAPLNLVHSLHACIYTIPVPTITNRLPPKNLSSIVLPISGLSQMQLPHPRHHSMCSPTSTTAVLRYLLNNNSIDPLHSALKSYDRAFNIFGNWALNVAHASSLLGNNWNCWVEKLNSFDDIYEQLRCRIPVIVSIKGPLEGSASPYNSGHLIVIRGYDAESERVLCMDPAFSTDRETLASYKFIHFIDAWNRRDNTAYMFSQSTVVKDYPSKNSSGLYLPNPKTPNAPHRESPKP